MALAAHPGAAAAPLATPGLAAPRTVAVAQCSWDHPGHDPFMGEVVPAIDRYTDIPHAVRARLKERMAVRRYDDIVEIRRDSIRGQHDYRPEIRDMHFGLDRVCRQVTRAAWSDTMVERGLVYCDAGHCILVPTVCRNVSRIERRPRVGAPIAKTPPLPEVEVLAFDPAEVTPLTFMTAPDPGFVGEPGLPPDLAFDPDPGPWTPVTIVTLFDGRNPWTGRPEGYGGVGGGGGGGGRGGDGGWPGAIGGPLPREDRQPHDGTLPPRSPWGPPTVDRIGPPASDTPWQAVPEPATWALLCGGVVAGWFAARRRETQGRASRGARNAPG